MNPQQVRVSLEYKDYLIKARNFFEKNSQGMLVENHYQHNLEPNFWEFMIEPVLKNKSEYEGSLAFEFGCGAGRNLVNLLVAGNFSRADGIDISKGNAKNSIKFVEEKIGANRSICLEGNGYTCLPFPSDSYAYAVSHQVFIHIPNRDIRLSILADLYRILLKGGILVIHFKQMDSSVSYSSNHNNFPMNVTISKADSELIIDDFESIGFRNVIVNEVANWVDGKMEFFIQATK